MSVPCELGFLQTLTLLYVEDDAETRHQAEAFLARRFRRVVVAAEGAEGLEAFHREKPDLVLTDILMPGMDGLTMIAEIRRENRQVPVLVSTAFEETHYLERCIELGVDRFLVKPLDTRCLQEALLEVGGRLQAEAELGRLREAAQRMAYQESLAILARGLAHDFNNLLQGILGWASVAQHCTEAGSRARHALDKVAESSALASELAARLTLLAGGHDHLGSRGPLGPVLRRAVDEVFQDAAGVKVDLRITSEAPVDHDPERLHEALVQVLRNAREAMPSGGELEVCLDGFIDGAQAAPQVHLRIRDTGGGIPRELQHKVFAPYFTTKEVGARKGTGLGLAVCQAIIRSHCGVITLDSEPGRGTQVDILLPVSGGRTE